MTQLFVMDFKIYWLGKYKVLKYNLSKLVWYIFWYKSPQANEENEILMNKVS